MPSSVLWALDRWCRSHDDECRKMAAAAGKIYDKFVSKEAALDYVEMVRTLERGTLLLMGWENFGNFQGNFS